MIRIDDLKKLDSEKVKSEAQHLLLTTETMVAFEALARLLVSKGIISQAEVEDKMAELLTSPEYEYSEVYNTGQKLLKIAQLIEDNPQSFLQKLIEAKDEGII